MTFRLIALGASFAALVLALPGTGRADDPKSDPPKAPFTFAVAYTADALDNADGGRAQGARYLDKLALSIAYDGAAAGHDGWTALASAQHANGVARRRIAARRRRKRPAPRRREATAKTGQKVSACVDVRASFLYNSLKWR